MTLTFANFQLKSHLPKEQARGWFPRRIPRSRLGQSQLAQLGFGQESRPDGRLRLTLLSPTAYTES